MREISGGAGQGLTSKICVGGVPPRVLSEVGAAPSVVAGAALWFDVAVGVAVPERVDVSCGAWVVHTEGLSAGGAVGGLLVFGLGELLLVTPAVAALGGGAALVGGAPGVGGGGSAYCAGSECADGGCPLCEVRGLCVGLCGWLCGRVCVVGNHCVGCACWGCATLGGGVPSYPGTRPGCCPPAPRVVPLPRDAMAPPSASDRGSGLGGAGVRVRMPLGGWHGSR